MIVGAAAVSATAAAGVGLGQPDHGVRRRAARRRSPALTLLAIALGAVAANVLNVYSGAMAFLSAGVDVPLRWARAVVALAFGVVGFVIALLALADAAHSYEAFLLVIVYWIGPWLGVVLTDQYLRRGRAVGRAALRPGLPQPRRPRSRCWSASWCRCRCSPTRCCSPVCFRGCVPGVGDVTFLVGFVLCGRAVRAAVPAGCGAHRGTRRVRPVAPDPRTLIDVALDEARAGLDEGGIPIGAALFAARRHAARAAGTTGGCRTTTRRCTPRPPRSAPPGGSATTARTMMVTTLSPCWYCSGLVRQFGIGARGDRRGAHVPGGHDWLAEHGVADHACWTTTRCVALMTDFIAARPELWNEDIGEALTMIPTIDLAAWRAGDPAVGPTVDDALQQAGFLLVTGHGVDADLRADVRAAARRFFALPAEVKQRYAVRIGGRGWLAARRGGQRLRRGRSRPHRTSRSRSPSAPDTPPATRPSTTCGSRRTSGRPRCRSCRAAVGRYVEAMRAVSRRAAASCAPTRSACRRRPHRAGHATPPGRSTSTGTRRSPRSASRRRGSSGSARTPTSAPSPCSTASPAPAACRSTSSGDRLGRRPVRPGRAHRQHRRPARALDRAALALRPAPGAARRSPARRTRSSSRWSSSSSSTTTRWSRRWPRRSGDARTWSRWSPRRS